MINSAEVYSMEHVGDKHTHFERNVLYHHKYNFQLDNSGVDYKDIKEREENGWNRETVIAASLVANEMNEGEYIKVDQGVYSFAETPEGSRYLQMKLPNKEILVGVLHLYPHLIQPKHMNAAKEIIKELEMDFMFKIMSENMNEFESGIATILATTDKLPKQYWGVAAYLPTYAVKKVWEREVTDRSENSVHLTSTRKDGLVFADITVLKANSSQSYPGLNVSAITSDGNRISFFSTKEIWEVDKDFTISAKVKSHGTVWNQDHIAETRLNYVKAI
jgi:hypothetical protein